MVWMEYNYDILWIEDLFPYTSQSVKRIRPVKQSLAAISIAYYKMTSGYMHVVNQWSSNI